MADRAVPPDVSSYLQDILDAVYGEDVRTSIHHAIRDMNTQLSNAILNQLIQVDNTLTLTGYGADAKKVGDLFADTLVMKGDLDSNTDLNTITVTGIYRLLASRITSFVHSWIPNSEGEYIDDQYVPGQPMPNSTGFLIVIKNATVVHQKIFYLNSSSTFIQRNAIRVCRDLLASPVAWSDWVENVDPTLSVFGNAADAKMVGNRFADDEAAIENHRLSSLMLNKNYRGGIYTGENLNNKTTPGSFTVNSDTNVTNAPVNSKGVLYVFDLGSTNVKMQAFFEDNGTYYIRTKSGSTWSDWKKGSSGAGESIADPFSATSSTTYAAGDYVTYKDKLWKCASATTGGTWNASKWDEAIVMDELLALKADVVYTPVAISSFTINPTTVEMGSTITSITYSFGINKVPVTLTLDGTAITPRASATNQTLGSLSVTANKTFTLTATDNGSSSFPPKTVSKTATLSFLNNRCYGVKAIPQTIDSTFILSLGNKELTSSKAKTFSVNAGSPGNGLYIWYAVPTRLGTCRFTVGGFEGGFESAQTVSVTNASGYTENYYVYRSTQDGLGETEVVVS